jgi:DNA anti-recombination protein RmuC
MNRQEEERQALRRVCVEWKAVKQDIEGLYDDITKTQERIQLIKHHTNNAFPKMNELYDILQEMYDKLYTEGIDKEREIREELGSIRV